MLTENYCVLWVDTGRYAMAQSLMAERGRENPQNI
jgi:hypothetical protein